MRRGDVFAVSWQGGGGWGDPLDRVPSSVLRDLYRGAISPRTAAEIFGLVTSPNGVDEPATAARRHAIRRARVGEFQPARTVQGELVMPMGPAMSLVRDGAGVHVVTQAGHVLCSGHTRWREGALSHRLDPATLPKITLHTELAMTAWYCPASGTQLAVDIHRADERPAHDIELKESQV